MAQRVYYFDYAAATPIDRRVLAAMEPYFSEKFYNPSSPYSQAVEVRREYEAAKQQIARAIGATADELVMTAGATESINLAIGGYDGHKITTTIDHTSVKRAVAGGGEFSFVRVDERGRVDPELVRAAIRPDTQLVSVALANHEIGTVQPLRDIGRIIHDIRQRRKSDGDSTPLVLHCDASQGFGLLDVHVGRLGVDLLTLNAAKIYGPKQVGLLWVRPGVYVKPTLRGGGQEAGLEAVRIADKKRQSEARDIGSLRDTLERTIADALPGVVISGHRKYRLANFCHVSFPGIDAERLVFILEREGVMVATGSACAANSGTRSEVLSGIGLSDEAADGSIRLTVGRDTTKEDILHAADRIVAAVHAEAERTGVRI
ncbi:MAG: aminotransferase, class V [Candidatus Saccharibacteria bacterium GW2011_GWC2_48_9]|nr:MAG: aminotransferase, class V [Candidatus Saccharibacteria bacterium GW2011_GWC2_48_9]